jgi:hypothetical protein
MFLTTASFHWVSGDAPRWQPGVAALAATMSSSAFRFVRFVFPVGC